MEPLYGGVEAGGTKFACAVGKRSGEVLDYLEIPTTTAPETLQKVVEFFKSNKSLVSIGIGSFGPLDLDSSSATYGYITNTPKEGWSNTNIRGVLAKELKLSIEINTDVGCAAMGEYFFGVAKGIKRILYLTIGTGIGGATLIDGNLQNKTSHPEMGHILIPHDLEEDPFHGVCPFHGDCFEGLASGLAIEKRVGQKAEHVIDPMRWDLEVHYLALGITNLISVLDPKIVVLGGGVINHGGLVDEVYGLSAKMINNYMTMPPIAAASDKNAVMGAIRLASQGH